MSQVDSFQTKKKKQLENAISGILVVVEHESYLIS